MKRSLHRRLFREHIMEQYGLTPPQFYGRRRRAKNQVRLLGTDGVERLPVVNGVYLSKVTPQYLRINPCSMNFSPELVVFRGVRWASTTTFSYPTLIFEMLATCDNRCFGAGRYWASHSAWELSGEYTRYMLDPVDDIMACLWMTNKLTAFYDTLAETMKG